MWGCWLAGAGFVHASSCVSTLPLQVASDDPGSSLRVAAVLYGVLLAPTVRTQVIQQQLVDTSVLADPCKFGTFVAAVLDTIPAPALGEVVGFQWRHSAELELVAVQLLVAPASNATFWPTRGPVVDPVGAPLLHAANGSVLLCASAGCGHIDLGVLQSDGWGVSACFDADPLREALAGGLPWVWHVQCDGCPGRHPPCAAIGSVGVLCSPNATCVCATGRDPTSGCATCLSGFAPVVDSAECAPCAERMHCYPQGTATVQCNVLTRDPSLVDGVCICKADFMGPRCDACSNASLVLQVSSGVCRDPAAVCSSFGYIDHVGECRCRGYYSGARCDECRLGICGPNGNCNPDPLSAAWCVCNATAPPGFVATAVASSRCEQCPVGAMLHAGVCTEVATVCGTGAHLSVAASHTMNVCTCVPGYRPDTGCEACTEGFSRWVADGPCLPCTEVCGSAAEACDPDAVFPGACGDCPPGVAGPPCTQGSCAPGFVGAPCRACPPRCLATGGRCVAARVGGDPTCACVAGAFVPEVGCGLCGSSEVLNQTSGQCVRCPVCAHGGWCVEPGICACPEGFDPATRCETCLPTWAAVTGGHACVPCAGAGAHCGTGVCFIDVNSNEHCACAAGSAFNVQTAQCEPCGLVGQAAGAAVFSANGTCARCPARCPAHSGCVFVTTGAVVSAVCTCEEGFARPQSQNMTIQEYLARPCVPAWLNGSLVVLGGTTLGTRGASLVSNRVVFERGVAALATTACVAIGAIVGVFWVMARRQLPAQRVF